MSEQQASACDQPLHQMYFSGGLKRATEVEIGLSPVYRGRVIGAFDKYTRSLTAWNHHMEIGLRSI
jgi:hypothetical protein